MNENIHERIKKTGEWSIIFIILAEWFPFLLYMLLNFFNYGASIPILDTLLLVGIFFAPMITSLMIVLLKNSKILQILIIVSSICSIVLLYIFYLSFHRIGIELDDPTALDSMSPIVGFIISDGSVTKQMMFLANAVIFCILIPLLLTDTSNRCGSITIGRETYYGFIIASLYMGLRIGSITSTPLRTSIILFIFLALYLTISILEGPKKESDQENDKINLQNIKVPGGTAFYFLISLAFGIFSISDSGILYKTEIWFLGIAMGGIMLFGNSISDKKSIGLKISSVLFAFSLMLFCLMSILPHMMQLGPAIKIFTIFGVSIFMSGIHEYFNKNRNTNGQEKQKSKGILILRNIFATYGSLIAYLLGFIVNITQPFTNIAFMIIIGVQFLFLSKALKR